MSKRVATGDKRRRSGGRASVAGLAILLFVLAAVILLGALWLAQGAADQERAVAQQREVTAVAASAAGRLAGAIAREQAQLAALARNPHVVEAARAAAPTWPDGVDPQFPGAMRVALFPRGWDRASPGAEPPVGYALLDMLRAAEATAQPPPPEAHLLGRPMAHVNVVQPVLDDADELVGTLVLSYPASWVGKVLARVVDTDGRLAVTQAPVDDDGAQIAEVGERPESPVHSIQSVQGTSWQVHFTAPTAPRVFDPLTDRWFLTITGVSLTLLALAVWVVARVLRRRLLTDAQEWSSVAREAARGKVAAGHGMALDESQRTLEATLPDLGARPSPSPPVEEPAPPPASAGTGALAGAAQRRPGAARYDDPDDLLSGLEVEENLPQEAAAQFEERPTGPAPVTSEESSVPVDASLFRAYDIRGVVDKGLSAEVVRLIGRAVGSEAAARDCPAVVVGRDGRLSSPALAEALIEGLRSTGRDVIDIGRVPTPVTYFATYHLGTGSGVEVTGSHNPPDYNGLKVMLGGETLSGEAISDLHRRIRENDLLEGEGSVRRQDLLGDYIDRIAGDVTLHRPLKVVVDCGNGVAGEAAPLVLRSLGCEVEELFCDIDGTFPNHHPDPSVPANLETLIATVREHGADVGLAFDGDGDRLGVVDAGGKIIWPDRLMMLFAIDILSRQPGADIIFDVKCSAHLARIITENAGVPLMWRTGHSLIKAKLKETGAPLAGEMSGHLFFNDRWDGFDDGIYAAARLLEILSLDPRTTTEIFADLPETVSTPELKIHLEEGEPPAVIDGLVERARFPEARVTTIDGLRVDFLDGWGLVRASNTTPCLVLRFEADTEEALARIKQSFRELIADVRPDLSPDF